MKKILIAEDDKKIGAALEIRLKAAGYEVQIVPDGSESLRLAIQERPDLILMDIWMPSLMGFAVAKRLKRVGLSEIPIIFMTASKKTQFWRMAQEAGADGLFEKPFDTEELLRAISGALQPRHSTKEGVTR